MKEGAFFHEWRHYNTHLPSCYTVPSPSWHAVGLSASSMKGKPPQCYTAQTLTIYSSQLSSLSMSFSWARGIGNFIKTIGCVLKTPESHREALRADKRHSCYINGHRLSPLDNIQCLWGPCVRKCKQLSHFSSIKWGLHACKVYCKFWIPNENYMGSFSMLH